jgi:DNA invertase Pin-like site-specific DNA recombinase
VKRAAIYCRVSTADQHIESQLYDLRALAAQRGLEVIAEREYIDHGISGTKARRPGLDKLLADAGRHKFDVVLVAAFDRIARSTKHFLIVMDELDNLGIEFISRRENIDTSGPMGRFFIVLIGALAEAERSMLIERIKSGMRRRKLEGFALGRAPLDIDHESLVHDRMSGMSLTQVAKRYGVSRASVVRWVRLASKNSGATLGKLALAAQRKVPAAA